MKSLLCLVGAILLLFNHSISDDIKFRNGQRLQNCLVIDTIGVKVRIQTSEDIRFYPLTTIVDIQRSHFDTTKATLIEDLDGNKTPIWIYKESLKDD